MPEAEPPREGIGTAKASDLPEKTTKYARKWSSSELTEADVDKSRTQSKPIP